jgi:hypothetical protein
VTLITIVLQITSADFKIGCGPCWTDTSGIHLMENLLEVPLQRHDDRPRNLPDILDSLYSRRPDNLVYFPHIQGFCWGQRSSFQNGHVVHHSNDGIRSGLPYTCQFYDWLLRTLVPNVLRRGTLSGLSGSPERVPLVLNVLVYNTISLLVSFVLKGLSVTLLLCYLPLRSCFPNSLCQIESKILGF